MSTRFAPGPGPTLSGVPIHSLSHDLATIVLRSVGIVAAVVLAGVALRHRGGRSDLRVLAGAVAAGLVLLLAVGQLADVSSALLQQYRARASASVGRSACFGESPYATPSQLHERIPFVTWARRQMGVGAVYAFASFTPPPDFLCTTFALLPALPAQPGQPPDWEIALGTIPTAMQAKIAAHDPAVKVYEPGFAIERGSRP